MRFSQIHLVIISKFFTEDIINLINNIFYG